MDERWIFKTSSVQERMQRIEKSSRGDKNSLPSHIVIELTFRVKGHRVSKFKLVHRGPINSFIVADHSRERKNAGAEQPFRIDEPIATAEAAPLEKKVRAGHPLQQARHA